MGRRIQIGPNEEKAEKEAGEDESAPESTVGHPFLQP
jgi:hypothetical protein